MDSYATQALIFYPLMGAFLLVSIRCWWWIIEKRIAGEPLLLNENQPVANTGLIDVVVAMAAWAAAGTIATVGFMRLHGLKSFKTEDLSIEQARQLVTMSATAQLAAVSLVACWLLLRYGFLGANIGFQWRRLMYDVRAGVVAFFSVAPFIYGLQLILSWLIPYKHPLIDLVHEDSSPLSFLAIGFAAVLAAPIAEEFWFRWILQGWLDKLVRGSEKPSSQTSLSLLLGGPTPETTDASKAPPGKATLPKPSLNHGIQYWLPVVASAIVFAGVHIGHGPAPIPLFFLALLLGWLMQKTGRITASIVVHFMLNSCTTILLLIELLTKQDVDPQPIVAWILKVVH